MNEQITFSTLLSQLINESDATARQIALGIQKKLKSENSQMKFSYPAFNSYRNFTAVPSYEKAAIILNYFNYEISNDELAEILDYSRSELKKMKLDDDKDIRQGIRINPKNYDDGLSATELELIITRRIEELYGTGQGSVNTYINDLIKNDLKSSGYIR